MLRCASFSDVRVISVSVLFLQNRQALLDLLASFTFTKQLEKTISREEHGAITVFTVSLCRERFPCFVSFSRKMRMGAILV